MRVEKSGLCPENSTKNGVQEFHLSTRTCDTHLEPDGPAVPALGGQLHQEGETTALCTPQQYED